MSIEDARKKFVVDKTPEKVEKDEIPKIENNLNISNIKEFIDNSQVGTEEGKTQI